MNYLAHILLSGNDPEAQLGALLGDFAKPGSESNYNPVVAREIRLHRKVDAYTDSHAVVLASKARFGRASRRYAGIILDLLYDHFLASSWDAYCQVAIDPFVEAFYRKLRTTSAPLPERLRLIAPALIREDWLRSYADRDGFERAVRRVARRLSKGADAMISGLQDARAQDPKLRSDFRVFFPQLQAFVSRERSRLLATEAESHRPADLE